MCSSPSGKQEEMTVGRDRIGPGTPWESRETTDLFFSFRILWNAGSPTRKCGLELLNSRFGKWKDKAWRCVIINLEAQFFSSTVCWLISKDKLQNSWIVARDNELGLALLGAHALLFTKTWATGHSLGLSKQSEKRKQKARKKILCFYQDGESLCLLLSFRAVKTWKNKMVGGFQCKHRAPNNQLNSLSSWMTHFDSCCSGYGNSTANSRRN